MKIGRNDPCPCGSGLKYKQCCADKEHGESAVVGSVTEELADLLEGQNFDSMDDVNAFPFIQQSFLFSLYLLSRYGGEWRDNTFYEQCFLRAFPQLLADIPERMYTTPEQELRGMYSLRVLERYAGFVGLIEHKHPEKRTLDRTFQLRKLPLLDQVVLFHL